MLRHLKRVHDKPASHLPIGTTPQSQRTKESGVETLVGVHLGLVGSGLGAGRETCRVKSSGGLCGALVGSGLFGELSVWVVQGLGWLVVE